MSKEHLENLNRLLETKYNYDTRSLFGFVKNVYLETYYDLSRQDILAMIDREKMLLRCKGDKNCISEYDSDVHLHRIKKIEKLYN